MASQEDVRTIALGLPETMEEEGRFAFAVRNRDRLKAFAWAWLARREPKKARVPRPDVLAVRVANLDEKDILLSLDSGKYFTEPHHNGFPAVLVRLDRVNVPELRALLINAWRCQAPRALARTFAPDESLVDALMTAAEAPQPGSEPGAGEP